VEDELAVMQNYGVDVLVSKNSGGSAVAAKLEAARSLEIPVLMLERPRLPAVDREFDNIVTLTDQLVHHP
jgi:precorrin-6A/cobalt-precorrin-6A reductase